MAAPPIEPIEVLLVEDNPADIRLTEDSLHHAKLQNRVTVARDGEEALAILRRETPHENAVRPDLVLLDLNLPKVDGHEVLAAIRHDDALAAIPVVILTTSAEDRDVVASYRLHANAYVQKPVGLDAFTEVVQIIDAFWLAVVKYPPRKS